MIWTKFYKSCVFLCKYWIWPTHTSCFFVHSKVFFWNNSDNIWRTNKKRQNNLLKVSRPLTLYLPEFNIILFFWYVVYVLFFSCVSWYICLFYWIYLSIYISIILKNEHPYTLTMIMIIILFFLWYIHILLNILRLIFKNRK